MSGLDIEAIYVALADQLRAGIADAGGFTIKAHPSTAPVPAIEVWPDEGDVSYFETSGSEGLADVNILIRAFLSGANPESEWRTMARLRSSGTGHNSSVIDAVMADRTLGGVVADAFIAGSRWNPEQGTIEWPVAIQLNKEGAQV